MTQVSRNQVKFLNFAEATKFLNSIDSDIDTTRFGPDFSVFSKTRGIVAGCNFEHLCSLMNKKFNLGLNPKGCLQYPDGYLITFIGEVPQIQTIALSESEDLSDKTRADLFKLAKEKGLSLKVTSKKEEIISAILSA